MDKYSQRNKGKLEKKNIRLFLGDAAFLDEHFPRAGHTVIIRNLVRKFRRDFEAKLNQQENPDANLTDLDLDELTSGGSSEEQPG